MNNYYSPYPCPYYNSTQMYASNIYNPYGIYPYPNWSYFPVYNPNLWNHIINLRDYGPEPFVVNIEEATEQNTNFRLALWTGKHLQLTLMSIGVGEDIGLEMHPNVDQFIRIEEGQGIVKMGDCKDKLDFEKRVSDDYVILIPAGKWHNLINTGNKPIKLYSIYAPPEHPHGTVQKNREVPEAAEVL